MRFLKSLFQKKNRDDFKFTTNEIVRILCKNGTKEFIVNEEFSNGKYIHTSGIIQLSSGSGAGVLYYNFEGKKITAKWIDNNNLEIVHNSDLSFTKKEIEIYFLNDKVRIKYKSE